MYLNLVFVPYLVPSFGKKKKKKKKAVLHMSEMVHLARNQEESFSDVKPGRIQRLWHVTVKGLQH